MQSGDQNIRFIKRLKSINWVHLAFIVFFAEIITSIMNTLMGIIWWGKISADLILIGTVDAFAASLFVGIPVLYIYSSYRESEDALRKNNEELQGYRMNLERLVDERTSKLASALDQIKHEFSERKQAEDALATSEKQFRAIFEQSDYALIMMDPDTLGIVDVNPALTDLTGYSNEEHKTSGLGSIFSPYEVDSFRSNVMKADCSGLLKLENILMRKKDGKQIRISIRGKLINLDRGRVLICSVRDVSEAIRLKEEKNLLQARLIHINKMTTLGILASGVAHEINNPNNFIMANSRLISDAWLDASKVLNEYYRDHPDLTVGGIPYAEARYIMPRLISAISEGAERIRFIVANLKDVARHDSARTDNPVNISEVINSTVLLIGSQVKKYTDRFSVRISEDLPAVRGSRQQIEQVLLNIIINALQSLEEKDRAVEITCRPDDGCETVIIEVRDEGIGMSKETIEHIVEPFFSTRLEQGGTGLGLSISNSIVKEHNGTLLFSSDPGRGTTVSITLPAYNIDMERTP